MNAKLNLAGSTTPPADMVDAARKSLGDDYDNFITKYPGEITPDKLCKYIEERQWH